MFSRELEEKVSSSFVWGHVHVVLTVLVLVLVLIVVFAVAIAIDEGEEAVDVLFDSNNSSLL